MIVLGIDPSKRATGLAVIDTTMHSVLWTGFMPSKKDVPEEIAWDIHSNLIDDEPCNATLIAIEDAYLGRFRGKDGGSFQQNPQTLYHQGRLIGALHLLFIQEELEVIHISASQARAAVNASKGGKEVVMKGVEERYGFVPTGSKTRREAICDAIAIATAAGLLEGE